MLYAVEISSATEDYIWQERFTERLERARTGDAEAQFNVGEMYEKGSGVIGNMKKAFTWFDLAAKQNHQKAQFKIAYMYYRGEGVDANPSKAFQLMERVAKSGYERAQYYLGLMYEIGIVTPRDLAQAQVWYGRAAAGGYLLAQEALADKKRFPSKLAIFEPSPSENSHEELKSTIHVKASADAPPVQNASSDLDAPSTKNNLIPAALGKEAARGSGIALGLGLTDSNLSAQPLVAIASLQPVIQVQITPHSMLTSGNWVSQMNSPVEFLPSKLTSCESNKENGIECVSKELFKTVGESEIGYKTQATVYAVQPTGEFKITYRNNILKISRHRDSKTATDSEVLSQEIKLGWQETQHYLECKLENERTIQCLKNHIQKITLLNQAAQ